MTDYPNLSFFIDGEWIGPEGRETFPVVNPATGETIAELPVANAADLDRALDAAQRGFALWRATAPDERSRIMKRAAELLRSRAGMVARIATIEEGKTLREARIECMAGAACLEFLGEEARRIYGRVLARPTGMRALVLKEPVGPVAAFAPWNFPIGNPCRKFGAAIAAGCSIILKPAEEAPASALEVLKCLLEAGVPPQAAQIVFGGSRSSGRTSG